MKRFLLAGAMLLAASAPLCAQSMDDLDLQIHGFATQGFVYTTNNNWNTMSSSEGSAALTEAVVNVSAQPDPRLHIGIQARYALLGTYENNLNLDWAQADFKLNESFGVRAGKVKTPAGLQNETQDVDPAQMWILLPQSVYPLASRNSQLAHFGAVVYGTVPLGEKLGKMDYRAFGGERVIGQSDGFIGAIEDNGARLPSGLSGRLFGGTLAWHAPARGLLLGATWQSSTLGGPVIRNGLTGTGGTSPTIQPFFFGRFERGRLMVAAEYTRTPIDVTVRLPGIPAFPIRIDDISYYAMASYKLAARLTGGVYYSADFDRGKPLGPGRFQKDWAVATRFDVNPFLYAKVELHVTDGTLIGYRAFDNLNLVHPTTVMPVFKVGVSF